MSYVWDEDRGGRGHLCCVSAHRFSAKNVFAHSGTPDTSEVCMKACKMWDLHGVHVLLLGSFPCHLWLLLSETAGCCNWTKVIQINIGGQ